VGEKQAQKSKGRKIIYIGMIRKIYNMAQVTKKLEAKKEERKNIIIINFLKRNG
jgi:hypothetical protein